MVKYIYCTHYLTNYCRSKRERERERESGENVNKELEDEGIN